MRDAGEEHEMQVEVVRFDSTTDSVAVETLSGVSAVRDVDERELDPLARAIDPDALDRLVEGSMARSEAARCEVSFEYERVQITVRSDGVIRFCHYDGPADCSDPSTDP